MPQWHMCAVIHELFREFGAAQTSLPFLLGTKKRATTRQPSIYI